jgi:maltose O-acetyltransferase
MSFFIDSPGRDQPVVDRWQEARQLAGRALRAIHAEVELFHARRLMGQAMARALPHLTFTRTRTLLLRAAGFRLGPRARVMGPLTVTGGDHRALLSIGADSQITGPLHVDLGESVHIGDRVSVGHYVSLLTVDHQIGPAEERCGQRDRLPIVIGDGAWIGARVTVLPGVTIGAGAVVAAGAVVTRNVPANTLVAGVPAQVLRVLPREGVPLATRKRRRGRHGWTPSSLEQGHDLGGDGQARGQAGRFDAEEVDQPAHPVLPRPLYDEVLRAAARWSQLGAHPGIARPQSPRR